MSVLADCIITLRWRHNGHGGVSNQQRLHCLLNCWFRRRSKKTSKFRVTGLCEGNSPVTGEFPAQKACNAENVSIWWRHHEAASAPDVDYNMFVVVILRSKYCLSHCFYWLHYKIQYVNRYLTFKHIEVETKWHVHRAIVSIGSTLAQIMACRLFGAKLLSEPVLGYCKLDP